jgi:hypothetical protein
MSLGLRASSSTVAVVAVTVVVAVIGTMQHRITVMRRQSLV